MEVPSIHPHFRTGKLRPKEEKQIALGHSCQSRLAPVLTPRPVCPWSPRLAAEALESRGPAHPPWDPPVIQKRQERWLGELRQVTF